MIICQDFSFVNLCKIVIILRGVFLIFVSLPPPLQFSPVQQSILHSNKVPAPGTLQWRSTASQAAFLSIADAKKERSF